MDSKIPAISNTASATFRQVITSAYEKCPSDKGDGIIKNEEMGKL